MQSEQHNQHERNIDLGQWESEGGALARYSFHDSAHSAARVEQHIKTMNANLQQASLLGGIGGLLRWDERVYMPKGAGSGRAAQLALISKLHYECFTDKAFVEAVETLNSVIDQLDPDTAVNVRETKRGMDRAQLLSKEFMLERALQASESYSAWEAARPRNDFAAVLPHLEKMVALAKREAEALGYQESPYDALLDKHEPGLKLSEVKPLLLGLGDELSKMLPEYRAKFAEVKTPSGGPYSRKAQRKLLQHIAADLGYDFQRGRLDETAHPFAATLGPDDRRILTRYNRDDYRGALFGAIHETGHALYELGLPKQHFGTPRGSAISTGIHESQSRLWENLVGRSEPFAVYLHGLFKKYFPEEHWKLSPQELWRQCNKIEPGLIRIHADEVSYSQHIVVRMLLEEELICGNLRVQDLPGRWGELYGKYLGIEVPDFQSGVMQDVHWYSGMFGYFPSYALGNLYGAQMQEVYRKAIPDLDQQIARGNFEPLLTWLRENVHQHGRLYSSSDLLTRISGEPVSAEPFLRYLRRKFD